MPDEAFDRESFYTVDSPPGDLTGKGVEISDLLEEIQREGFEDRPVVVTGTEPLREYNSREAAFQYLHTFDRKAEELGFSHLLLDQGVDEKWTALLENISDERIETR
ncbi:MAG: hypothetical protein ABEJ93_04195 [Candidatus Nanohalobium sp.]